MTSVRIGGGRRITGRSLRLLVTTGLIAVGLAGCKTSQTDIVGSIPDDYRITHPIVVGEGLATFDVPVGQDTPYLTRDMQQNVLGFADEFRRSGSAAIAIVSPSGSANELAAAAMARQVGKTLMNAGIPRTAIDYRVYPSGPSETEAPVRLAYARIEARTQGCGPWPDEATADGENRHYHNYGCATQQNLAAMVANPVDLLHPRRMQPADAQRRNNVLDHYRSGEPTQTDLAREPQPNVAEGVGQ